MNAISSSFSYLLTLKRRIFFEVLKANPLCMRFCVVSPLKTDMKGNRTILREYSKKSQPTHNLGDRVQVDRCGCDPAGILLPELIVWLCRIGWNSRDESCFCSLCLRVGNCPWSLDLSICYG